MTNEEVLAEIQESAQHNRMQVRKNTGGITVKGIHDVAVRYSKCCSPVPGDEIVGFVTRGRGVSIHRTDCINILNLPEIDRVRLIDAEWQQTEEESGDEKYIAEISIYALNTRLNKHATATISVSFEIRSREELDRVIDKIRTIESVIDVERTTS